MNSRCSQFFFFGLPLLVKLFRVLLKLKDALQNLHTILGVFDAAHFDRQGEAVEQLRAQIAFLRVHRAHQDETRRVRKTDALAHQNRKQG